MSFAPNSLYIGNNNQYADMPALMSDDRAQRSWYTESVVDHRLKQDANITSNWEYRKYLTANAMQLMDINKRNAVMQNAETSFASPPDQAVTTPYVYKGVDDMTQVRPGVFASDLKTVYLSREQLQSKAVAPGIYSTTSR